MLYMILFVFVIHSCTVFGADGAVGPAQEPNIRLKAAIASLEKILSDFESGMEISFRNINHLGQLYRASSALEIQDIDAAHADLKTHFQLKEEVKKAEHEVHEAEKAFKKGKRFTRSGLVESGHKALEKAKKTMEKYEKEEKEKQEDLKQFRKK